jgi:hypothetical protein
MSSPVSYLVLNGETCKEHKRFVERIRSMNSLKTETSAIRLIVSRKKNSYILTQEYHQVELFRMIPSFAVICYHEFLWIHIPPICPLSADSIINS